MDATTMKLIQITTAAPCASDLADRIAGCVAFDGDTVFCVEDRIMVTTCDVGQFLAALISECGTTECAVKVLDAR